MLRIERLESHHIEETKVLRQEERPAVPVQPRARRVRAEQPRANQALPAHTVRVLESEGMALYARPEKAKADNSRIIKALDAVIRFQTERGVSSDDMNALRNELLAGQ